MVAKFVLFLAFLVLVQAGLVRRGVPEKETTDLSLQQMERQLEEFEKNIADLEIAKQRGQALANLQKFSKEVAATQAESFLKLREAATKQ